MKTARDKKSFRRLPGRRPGRRVLIVCEGDKTEPNYFQQLRNELRSNGVTVEIYGKECGSAPISVVDFALAESRGASKRGEPFDSVWCVIDRDGHESFRRALDKALSNSIRIVASVPCFEYWLLLHYEYTAKPQQKCNQVLRSLLRHAPQYKKGTNNLSDFHKRRNVAVANAEKLSKENRKGSPNEAWPNPSTSVHELVKHLEGLIPYAI